MPASQSQTRRPVGGPEPGDGTRSDRKRRQILDGAKALFLEHGFDTTSMDAVAGHAGVSKATLYVHFHDKDALLLALVEDECGRLGAPMLWQPHDGPIALDAELRAIARAFLSFFMNDRGLAMHRLIMSCASRYPAIAHAFMKAGPDRCDAEVAAFLRAAERQGLLRIPDVKLAATQFLTLIQGRTILKWALSMQAPRPAECRALVDGGVRVFLAAYGVSATGTKPSRGAATASRRSSKS